MNKKEKKEIAEKKLDELLEEKWDIVMLTFANTANMTHCPPPNALQACCACGQQ